MNQREVMISKIRTIDTRMEMTAFLAALREDAPDIAGDTEVQRVIGEQQAKIYRAAAMTAEAESWKRKKK